MDIHKIKKYLECDSEFLENLIKIFMEEAIQITREIEKASINKNWSLVKLNAHKMLSSTKIFEIERLTIILEKIEAFPEPIKYSEGLKREIDQLIIEVEIVLLDLKISLIDLK